jgi:outer membrane lipoprotein-sorting protein
MHSLRPDTDDHDTLARAAAAMRNTAVPAGPPHVTVERTLSALQAASAARLLSFSLSRKWSWGLKAAAAVMLAVGTVYFASERIHVGAPLAFADVAQKLRDARTIAYQMTMRVPGQDKTETIRIYAKEGGVTRMESSSGQISVAQSTPQEFKVVTLDTAKKIAVVVQGKRATGSEASAEDPMSLVDELRKMIEKQGQPAGQRQIGSVEAEGFRVKEGSNEWLIWADPTTKLPVRVELKLPHDMQATLSEFRFNPELDDALFRLEIPDGYKVQPTEIPVTTPEEALVRLLRSYAETAAGQFPPRVDDWVAIATHFRDVRGEPAADTPSPDDLRLASNMAVVIAFLESVAKGDYGYRANDAKLGDANTIIFWYRPQDTSKHRALFADLHWSDVTTDLLPKVSVATDAKDGDQPAD